MNLSDLDIFFFAAVPWDYALHGRTQHLALGLRQLGARVTFVEPPSLKKTIKRLMAGRRDPVPGGVRLIAMPPSVPKISDRLPLVPRLHDAAQRAWLKARTLGAPPPLAIVSTPRWAPVLDGVELSALVYDCLDDLQVHAEPARLKQFAAWEGRLLARADASCAVSPLLAHDLESKGARRVEVLGNGVGFDLFVQRSVPVDPKGPRRRIGFVGALFEWIDLDLLAHLARALPEHELVLIGPARRGVDLSQLERLPNVRLPGYRAYADVPKAMASFDVALIPFCEGQVARACDPIKIYEYFCFGTPVVTTPVGEVERLGELLYVASGRDAFVEAVQAALAERRADLRERRIAFARANDWSERARAMGALLIELGRRPRGTCVESAASASRRP